MPQKVVRITGGVESEEYGDANDANDEIDDDTSVRPSTRSGNANRPASGYLPVLSSAFPSSTTAGSRSSEAEATTAGSKSGLAVIRTTKSAGSERAKRLGEFERRLPPSMVYPEPLKCPACDFTNDVRINLIRHLRTHRNDDDDDEEEDMEMESSRDDDATESVASESRQKRTWEDEGYVAQAAAAGIVMNTSHMESSTSSKPRFAQRSLSDCLVSAILNVFSCTYRVSVRSELYWVELGQSADGLGWIESHKMDP